MGFDVEVAGRGSSALHHLLGDARTALARSTLGSRGREQLLDLVDALARM